MSPDEPKSETPSTQQPGDEVERIATAAFRIARLYGKEGYECDLDCVREIQRLVTPALASRDREIERLKGSVRDMESTYSFGGQVMNQIVLPRVSQFINGEFPSDFLIRAMAERDQLRAQVKELTEDKERLDWIIDYLLTHTWDQLALMIEGECEDDSTPLREAIDEARKEKP